jgi:hypothetical protein
VGLEEEAEEVPGGVLVGHARSLSEPPAIQSAP